MYCRNRERGGTVHTTSTIPTQQWVVTTSDLTQGPIAVRQFGIAIALCAASVSSPLPSLASPFDSVALRVAQPAHFTALLTGNWCIQGPVVDFRHSTDKGETWTEERVNATGPSDNLFGETAAHNSKVKFGARETAAHPTTRPFLALYDSCAGLVTG